MWNGTERTTSYKSDCDFGPKVLGDQKYSHIEVFCSERLPITKTGYRSLFIQHLEVEAEGGAVTAVAKWLAGKGAGGVYVKEEKVEVVLTKSNSCKTFNP